jgi:hypothetical protein
MNRIEIRRIFPLRVQMAIFSPIEDHKNDHVGLSTVLNDD